MHLEWTDFPDAPAPGAFLCDITEVPDVGVLSTSVGDFPVLVLKSGSNMLCYVNACPHQFLPLDQRGGEVLSADGLHLLCSNHSAVFRISDGQGTEGEGLGCRLSLIPTEIKSNALFITK